MTIMSLNVTQYPLFLIFYCYQRLLYHHTHLSSFIYIKILNLYEDFHFLQYKKEEEGRKDTLPKHVVTQQWKFPFYKIFLLWTSSFRFCWIKVFITNSCYFFDDVSICNLHLLRIYTTINVCLNQVTIRISILCNW